jgi:CHASE2 domain-containing sensor protein
MIDNTGDRLRPMGSSILRPFLLSALLALVSTLLLTELAPIYAPGLLRFEHVLGDVRTAYLSERLASQHGHVALVGITDNTLKDFKVRQPIDRALLARLIEAIDAAGAKVIGMDILSARTPPPDNEDMLIRAIRGARAKIVLAAADDRIGLPKAHLEHQAKFIAATGRQAGYINLATEHDWVVRFKAQPSPGSPYRDSFAKLLAESYGVTVDTTRKRIAWLLEPRDGTETFLSIPAEIVLRAADDPGARAARAQLKDKIVIVGGLFVDLDRHLTPLTASAGGLQSGALIHAHTVAEMVDGRSILQLDVDSWRMKLALAAVTALAFLVGWYFHQKQHGIVFGSFATAAIIVVDTFVFWQWRIILPMLLALLAWFLGEFAGLYLGRWLGQSSADNRGSSQHDT